MHFINDNDFFAKSPNASAPNVFVSKQSAKIDQPFLQQNRPIRLFAFLQTIRWTSTLPCCFSSAILDLGKEV